MKKLLILCCIGLLTLSANAQFNDTLSLNLLQQITKQTMVPRYKMYKTDNTYILLKLDTRIGKVWMVQYGIKGSAEPMTIEIDESILISDKHSYNGRYELYPTNNIYNFIMLDTEYGYTYQVQWYPNNDKKCFVRRIY